MTAAAKIYIIGHPNGYIIDELIKIKAWQNGKHDLIHVHLNDDIFIRDSIENVENALHSDLQDYIHTKFPNDRYATKSDGNSIIHLIDNPDNHHNENGSYKKAHRKHATNYTPPKKRRK